MALVSNNITDLKEQLFSSQENNNKTNRELTKREEQIIMLKVDLASVQEKLKLREEEVISYIIRLLKQWNGLIIYLGHACLIDRQSQLWI